MNDYELTIILKKEDSKVLAELLAKIGAKVVSKKDAEKRSLAYEIAKTKEAFYAFFEISLKPEGVAELEQKLKLQDNVLRYLIVKKE